MHLLLVLVLALGCAFIVNAQVTSFNVSLVGKLNDTFVLKSAIDDRIDKWLLLTGPPKSNVIYENGKIQNNKYSCDVVRNKCDLKLNPFDASFVGTYRRQGSRDTQLSLVDYHVALYELPLKIDCLDEKCAYNSENKTLSVKANQEFDFINAFNFIKSINNSLSVDIYFKFNNESIGECNQNLLVTKKNDRLLSPNSQRDLDMIELSKDCTLNLTSQSTRTPLVVGLRYDGINENTMIDEIDIQLDVHTLGKDEKINLEPKIQSNNKEYSLVCPYYGNPIQYLWQMDNQQELITGTREVMLSNLSPGTYKYTCTAISKSQFYAYEKQPSVEFTVKVTEAKVTMSKKNIMIIGLSVGGGVLVLLVVILVVVILKKNNSSKGKYEGPVPTNE